MFNKKGFFVLIAIISIICITGCSNTNDSKETGNNNLNSSNITENSNSEQNNKKDKEEEKKKEPEYTKESLDEEISKQPVIVYSTEYLVQDADYKCLYPDLLIANIKNNSETDVKKAEVAFVAWDNNGFPVKIDPKYGSSSYIQTVKYDDVNLTNGQTYDETGLGLGCTSESNIKTFKAIVVSYTDFDGNTWKNPLYSTWKNFYEDKKLN